MFHYRLIELEAELLAREESRKGYSELPPSCLELLNLVEDEVGITLAARVPSDWRGWLSYRRNAQSLVILRGRAFVGGRADKCKAGLDLACGMDTISEYERGFDVSPPQDLDHLLLNFGGDAEPKAFLWYGENISPYRLIHTDDATADNMPKLTSEMSAAIVQACQWIIRRPKGSTLTEYLKTLSN